MFDRERVGRGFPSVPSAMTKGRAGTLLGLGLLSSLAIRMCLWDFVTRDMSGDMLRWAKFIEVEGAWEALGQEFSNYPPLYLYFLTVATWIPLPRLYAIKVVYLVFDYIVAGYVAGIVRHRYGWGLRSWGAALVTLFLPTMVCNASLWGQCDAMYTSGMVACVYYLLKRRPIAALVGLAIAFSLKPQAVFFAPLILALLVTRRIPPLALYVVPGIYVALAIPCWMAGRPLMDLILLYANQRILPFPSLTLGATNLYQWLSDEHFSVLYPAGLILAGAVVLGSAWLMVRRYSDGLDDESLVRMALFSAVLMPYVLPAMHERYFFPADVLAVVYAFLAKRGWVLAVLVQTASFFTYLPYLFDLEPVPRPLLAILMTAVLAILGRDLVRAMGQRKLESM